MGASGKKGRCLVSSGTSAALQMYCILVVMMAFWGEYAEEFVYIYIYKYTYINIRVYNIYTILCWILWVNY